MAQRDGLPELADTELEVMKALWQRGKLSAREVHEAVGPRLGWALSTSRTVLERLVRKGVVGKEPFHGLHLYTPRISRARGLARRVREFAAAVLEMEPGAVVSLFSDSPALSPEEVAELAQLLGTRGSAGGGEGEEP